MNNSGVLNEKALRELLHTDSNKKVLNFLNRTQVAYLSSGGSIITTVEAFNKALHDNRSSEEEELVRYKYIKEHINVPRSTLAGWEDKGLFPQRVDVGPRSIRWKKREVDAYIAGKRNWTTAAQ